jgi:hypothetical protein
VCTDARERIASTRSRLEQSLNLRVRDALKRRHRLEFSADIAQDAVAYLGRAAVRIAARQDCVVA